MSRKYLLIPICCLVSASAISAASVSLNLTSGYLYGSLGTAEEQRLPAGTLFVLVADLDGNGFDPIVTNGAWVGGADLLIEVSDSEYNSGTFGFDLTAGAFPENGFLSRTLSIDLGQFGSRTEPVPIALRWFPTLAAATTNFLTTSPELGTSYGELSRAIPVYPGMDAWVIDLSGGAILDLDPLATSDFGGIDSPESAMATFTVIPEPSTIVATLSGLVLLTLRRRTNK